MVECVGEKKKYLCIFKDLNFGFFNLEGLWFINWVIENLLVRFIKVNLLRLYVISVLNINSIDIE